MHERADVLCCKKFVRPDEIGIVSYILEKELSC